MIVSDNTTHKAFGIHKTLFKQKSLDNFLFSLYQNYTLALIFFLLFRWLWLPEWVVRMGEWGERKVRWCRLAEGGRKLIQRSHGAGRRSHHAVHCRSEKRKSCTVWPRLSGHQLSGYLSYLAVILQCILCIFHSFPHQILLKTKTKWIKICFHSTCIFVNDNLSQIQ